MPGLSSASRAPSRIAWRGSRPSARRSARKLIALGTRLEVTPRFNASPGGTGGIPAGLPQSVWGKVKAQARKNASTRSTASGTTITRAIRTATAINASTSSAVPRRPGLTGCRRKGGGGGSEKADRLESRAIGMVSARSVVGPCAKLYEASLPVVVSSLQPPAPLRRARLHVVGHRPPARMPRPIRADERWETCFQLHLPAPVR
jgi:hypothetical protein